MAVPLVCIAVAASGNLIVNPGFEDGLTGWTTLYSAASISTDIVHSGSKAFTFMVGNPLSGTMALKSLGVRPGPISELSFWCRVDPPIGAVYTIDVTTVAGGPPGATATTGALTPGQWTFFELHQFFVTPTFSELRFYFVSQNLTAGTRVYIDDVRLIPAPLGALGLAALLVPRRRR